MRDFQKLQLEQEKFLKEQNRKAYDWIAENYTIEWGTRPDKPIVNRFLELLPANSRILDIGCGPAHYSRIFSENGHGVFAADISFGMLIQAKKIWPTGQCVQMDMQNMGFPSKCFDALWVCTSFAHIPESSVPQTLAELRRVLKDYGTFFINAVISSNILRVETAEEMKDYNKPGRFYQMYNNREHFENYLIQANFIIIDTIIRTVYSYYDKYNDYNKISPKDAYKVNQWINFYCELG